MTEEQVRAIIRDELSNFLKMDRYVFDKNIQILDGRKIQAGRTTGLIIGSEGGATGQKLAFFGQDPIIQPAHIGNSAGDDAATVNAILTALENLGLLRTS